MALLRPFVIVSYPRSGSSMVAGLLHAHGVWCGKCRPPDRNNPRGYYEHLGVERLVGQYVGHSVNKGKIPEAPAGWVEMVSRLMYGEGLQNGQPWLYKCSAVYWKLWRDFAPHWVVVERPREAVLASGRKSGRYRGSAPSIKAHEQALADVKMFPLTTVVSADALIHKEYDRMRQVLWRQGIEFDEELADEFIDPILWHH